MRIFLTGSTGLVGAHTALALLEAGHQLRLLVRNADLARGYFQKLGHEVDDLVVGDMADQALIEKSLEGCDALVHAAAMVSLESKKARQVYDTNVEGARVVIGSACKKGIPNILYVSSLSVMFTPGAQSLNEHTPFTACKEAYARSKLDSDRYVRALQKQGAPIQMTYPSGVFGPNDPKLSTSNMGLIEFVKTLVPITSSGMQVVDARDLGRVHRLLLEKGCPENPEEGRFIVGGFFYPWPAFADALEQVTGRKMRRLRIPGPLFRAIGIVCDAIRHVYPIEFPITTESMAVVTQCTSADSSRIKHYLEMDFRDGTETFADTIRWLVEAGLLDARAAGRLG